VKGTLLIYRESGAITDPPIIVELSAPPDAQMLHKAVGGYLELVPWFNTIAGKRCVAFCDEEAKLKNRPPNRRATIIWQTALKAQGASLYDESGNYLDYLAGPVVVIFGDDELMESL